MQLGTMIVTGLRNYRSRSSELSSHPTSINILADHHAASVGPLRIFSCLVSINKFNDHPTA